MAISMKKYVDIKSAINTTRTATEKDLIARIFTTSDLVPVGTVVECETLADVGNIFASSSDEYKIASKYFSFINKYARSPKKISFARDFSAGFESYVIATKGSEPLSAFKSVSATGMTWTYGNITRYKAPISSSDFASCSSLSDLATLVQGWIRTAFSGDDVLQSCTLTYDSETNTFKFQTGETDDVLMSMDNRIADMMGLSASSGAIISAGAEESTYSEVFEASYQISNNFATFVFLGLDDSTEIATLADYVKQNHQSEFMMIVPVTSSNYATIQGATATIDGVSLELCGTTEDDGKFNFVLPMSITATTDYNKENGTVNYMFTQDSNMKVVVDDDTTANTYDNLKINYYGRTQQAGQKLAFYQNGVLQGNYQDQNIFVNEIWLKDALTTKYINYMLLTANWYANKSGQAIGQGLAMSVIERAKLNGTITTEKEISEADKVYIYNITANEEAWRQIYQEGYYLATNIEKKTINNQETYVFNYILLYSKGDSIKKVEGLDILI